MDEERGKLEAQAMDLYNVWGEEYRNAISEYLRLLEEAKKLKKKIKRIEPLPKNVINEFPKIDFLGFRVQENALNYLKTLSDSELSGLVERIGYIVEFDYSYRTVVEKNKSLRYKIARVNVKTPFGVNPDKCLQRYIGSPGKKPKYLSD